MSYNVGTPYYCTTSDYGVVTIGDINDADQQNNNIGAVYEYDDLERNCMPDSPAYYSNCFKGGKEESVAER
jgi:hypothetical protein